MANAGDMRYLLVRDGPVVTYGNDMFLKVMIKMDVKCQMCEEKWVENERISL